MKSKWFHLKQEALLLRKDGRSIRDIEISLKIPRSTLSGWFKNIKLSKKQIQALKKKHTEDLKEARKKAIIWHNIKKSDRLKDAQLEAEKTLSKISSNKENIELGLALLYLGEGFKKSGTGIGNSDPLILKFFLKIMKDVYNINIENIGVYLHLRADQKPELMKKYWSKELKIPLDRFRKVSIDKRTVGKITYPNYKGVCVINCANIAIQRKLLYISRKFCERVVNMHA